MTSAKHGSCLDCFYLCEDRGFQPVGRIVEARPSVPALSVETDAGMARLSWRGAKSARFSHYNIYTSPQANVTPGQQTLLASPDAETFLDWRAPEGVHYYRVTQVTLDGLESPPSNEVSARRSSARP